MIHLALLLPVTVACFGCAGQQTRAAVLAPIAVAVWPDVKADAEAGIASRDEPDAAKALRLERLAQFDEAIQRLK